MLDVHRAADICAIFGAPESGKSHEIKACLAERNDPGLIVIDPDGEYVMPAAKRTSSCGELARLTQAQPYRVLFIPSDDSATGIEQFNFVCRVAWERAHEQGRVCIAVDELADFTSPQSAPMWWRRIVKRGRKHGISIFAASQRPADCEKRIFSLASRVRSGRLNRHEDRLEVARALNVPVEQVAALTGYQFIERDQRTGELRTG